MSLIKIAVLCLASAMASVACASNQGQPAEGNAKHDVVAAAAAGDYPKVIDLIDDLSKKSKSDEPLVQLLDYYIGEGPTLALDESISRRGKRILALLVAARKSAASCLPEYQRICVTSFPDGTKMRDEHIDRLIHAVRKGVILNADEEETSANQK